MRPSSCHDKILGQLLGLFAFILLGCGRSDGTAAFALGQDGGSWPDGASASPPKCPNSHSLDMSDPRSICAVRCASGSPASDVSVAIDPLPFPDAGAAPLFAAHVQQSNPQACDQTFLNVQAAWSGDFMNYWGQNSQWQFHVIANSVFGGGGVEVYAIGADSTSGPVGQTLSCTVYSY
jgi:hypothetical protein